MICSCSKVLSTSMFMFLCTDMMPIKTILLGVLSLFAVAQHQALPDAVYGCTLGGLKGSHSFFASLPNK